ncbi:MAG TPA: hypothetical protein VGS00_06610 [Thermoanaerobaculia bacterium]|nr:hypothetical protein [Thermoanaerobaculia bacterium]
MSARRLIAAVSAFFVAALLGPAEAAGGPPEPAFPGTASGSFSVDGKTIGLHYAYAMAQANPFDEKKTDTAILLTDKPLPEAAFAGVKDLEAAGRLEPHNSVLFVLDESGQAMREVVHHDTLGDMSLQMSGMTHANITIKSRAGGRIEGSAQTKGPEDFLKHKYEVRAQFQAPMRQAHRDTPSPDAKTGKKLPPGGGEPGKAYLALQDAIRKKDLAAIRKAKPADMPDMSDDDLRKGARDHGGDDAGQDHDRQRLRRRGRRRALRQRRPRRREAIRDGETEPRRGSLAPGRRELEQQAAAQVSRGVTAFSPSSSRCRRFRAERRRRGTPCPPA